MIAKLLFIPMFITSVMSYGQVKKKVGDFSVEFPSSPTYSVTPELSSYTLNTGNTILMTQVKRVDMLEYKEIMKKANPKEREFLQEKFYKGFIGGFSKTSGLTVIDVQDTYVGGYKGKRIDSLLYGKLEGFTFVTLTESACVAFQVFFLNDSAAANKEVTMFLSSIKPN
jgi:hypothetical protein